MTKKAESVESTIDAWESGQLGADEKFVKVASQQTHDALDEALELKAISIRLPVTLIEEFKLIADYNGIGYQPLMRKMLQRFAHAELKRMAIELSGWRPDGASGDESCEAPKPLKKAVGE